MRNAILISRFDMSCAQAHWVRSKPILRVMQLKLHKPTMAISYSLRRLYVRTTCRFDMSIRPIQVEVALYLGQNRYRKPRCRIGLLRRRNIKPDFLSYPIAKPVLRYNQPNSKNVVQFLIKVVYRQERAGLLA